MNETFSTLYSQLNPAQKKAVDTIEGAVMVIAGPGTGKTSILTLRIAHILTTTDVQPENILALTFTESGAYAMRKKLVTIIGTAGYKVRIHTFHGFCNDVIKQYPERFPRIIGSRAITEIDQIALMEKIIESHDLTVLKPYGDLFYYVKPALSEIRNLKREAITADDFEQSIIRQEKEFEDIPDKVHAKGAHKGKMKGEYIKMKEHAVKNKELLMLYRAYELALQKQKLYDFEDMIIEVIKTLRTDPDLLLILQETYQYILADEHQDANNAQNAILELLSNFHDNPNLFIVGDEKQAIFRFQGASLENFLYFKKMYPEAVLINLEENYRSTQTILDASHALISKNVLPEGIKRVSLISKAEKGKESLQIYECSTPDHEYAFLVSDIQKHIDNGVKADDIAILYRDNRDAFPLAHVFEKTTIPFRIESDNDILKDEQVRKILLILECINDLTNEEVLSRVLFIDFLKLDTLEVFKVFDTARKQKKSLITLVHEVFPELSALLASWASYAHNASFVEVFELVIRESGYLEYALGSEDSLEKMATLEVFFNEMKQRAHAEEELRKEYTLADFVEHLIRIREHGILTKVSTGLAVKGVRMMTAHKSKGLEFEYVYIVGAYDGHWGNKTQRKLFNIAPGASPEDRVDDERRLFYVALTRARKQVSLTYARRDVQGKEQLKTQFIDEIPDEYKNTITVSDVRETKQGALDHISSLFKGSTSREHHEVSNKEYLQNLFLEQGLSVTSLNNYLTCPWEYFFVNLVRLPRAQSKHQMYGTALHATLKTFFDKYKVEEDMSKEDLLKLFEYNLHMTLLSAHDYKESLLKGKKSLSAYFEKYNGTWNRSLLTEVGIQGVHIPIDIEGEEINVLLKGQLDKIEFINDTNVTVVDFKTGKKKSSSKENYHRQLVFYKLLLDLDEKRKYHMVSGELDFVEPDTAGKFSKEKFEISEDEVRELRTLVEKKACEIYTLSFWNTTCDEKDCEYCKLSSSLTKL